MMLFYTRGLVNDMTFVIRTGYAASENATLRETAGFFRASFERIDSGSSQENHKGYQGEMLSPEKKGANP